MTNSNKIVVIGSSNTDMVIKAEHLPQPGETIIGEDFLMNHGGKGANQAVAAARLGGKVVFVCKVGDDMFGREALEMFQKEGIDITYSYKTKEKSSGVALINVDNKGENTIVVASGANGLLSEADVQQAQAEIDESTIVLMQLETPVPTLTYAAKCAKQVGAKVVLNPAPAPKIPLPEELLKNVDIIIPNENEAEYISGIKITDLDSLRDVMLNIVSKGVKTVIITIGARGAYVFYKGELFLVPAFKVDAVDTTAAGDTFCGALCVALSEGQDMKTAVRFANKASSISVTRMGAQTSVPYRKEVVI
jgi:ribokinase